MPIQPTAHYAMGGIPTDVEGAVVIDEKNTVLPGFYAAGECACVCVHGANRLGTNSLLDILVFGRRAGRDDRRRARRERRAAGHAGRRGRAGPRRARGDARRGRAARTRQQIRIELEDADDGSMCGVFRTEETLER